MHDAASMCSRYAAGDLLRVRQGLTQWQRPAVQGSPERLAIEQFGDHVRLPVGRAHVIDSHDVGIVQRGAGAGFLFEALQPLGLSCKGSRQHFYRHVAEQTRVAGAIYLPMPPTPRRLRIP